MSDEEKLLDVSAPEEPTTEAETPSHLAIEAEDENVPASEPEKPKLERPPHIPDQFFNEKTGETNVEGLAKAYDEIRNLVAKGKHKVPDDGRYDLSDIPDIDSEDETLTSFLEIAKEESLSQSAVEKITKFYLDTNKVAVEEAETSKAAEIEKLGRNAEKIIASTGHWLTRLSESGVLSAPELEALVGASQHAVFVSALDKIRKSYNEPSIPTVNQSIAPSSITLDDIQSMMSDPRYGVDMGYTKGVERKVHEMHGEEYRSHNIA